MPSIHLNSCATHRARTFGFSGEPSFVTTHLVLITLLPLPPFDRPPRIPSPFDVSLRSRFGLVDKSYLDASLRMLSTFEIIDIDGPDRLLRMIVSLHPVLFWMFFVIGSPAMLPTNAHTYPNPCAPCARHRSHVDSSRVRAVQRVRITLGRSSQVQNLAASRLLMFSSSQPSRRKSTIQLSLIFAKFFTSISNSVFSVHFRFARSSLSCPSPGPVLRPSAPPRHHGVLSRILSDTTCNDIASICSINPCSGASGTGTAGARGIHWSVGENELASLRGPFAGGVPCAAFSLFQSLKHPFHSCAAYRCVTLCSYAFSHCSAPGTPGSSHVPRSRTVSDTLSSTVLLQQAAWEGVLRQVSGCAHAAHPWLELLILACVQDDPKAKTGTLRISSGLADLSDTSLLQIVRAVFASLVAINM